MKNYIQITLSIILFCTSSFTHAQDYVWGEEFKEGDTISAATFNQIFSTLQKLNRTPKDADLVGTWSCSAVWTGGPSGAGLTQDPTNTWLQSLSGAQLTMTATSASTSFPTGYTFSTGNPSPFVSQSGTGAVSGTFVLLGNVMISNGILGANNYLTHAVDVVSDERIIFFPNSTSPNLAKVVMCDSATPVPAAPTATVATNTQTTVSVAWTDQSSDETGFKIYRRLSTQTAATQLATAVTASPYVDSSLTEGQTAYYNVSAYNSNGESSKSGVANATLDSIKPTVTSHTPTTSQQVARSDRILSIVFSEAVNFICPADPANSGPSCSTAGSAITVVGTSCFPNCGTTYMNIAPYHSTGFGSSVLSVSGNLREIQQTLNANDTITVTIHKEWIRDVNGNHINADYSYSFTTGT
jgi:hypothetical protein